MIPAAISRILCLRPGTFVRIRIHRTTLAPFFILGCRVLLLFWPLCDFTLSLRATCKPLDCVPLGHPCFLIFLTRPPPRLQIPTRRADSVFNFLRLTPWIIFFPRVYRRFLRMLRRRLGIFCLKCSAPVLVASPPFSVRCTGRNSPYHPTAPIRFFRVPHYLVELFIVVAPVALLSPLLRAFWECCLSAFHFPGFLPLSHLSCHTSPASSLLECRMT